MKWYYYLHTNGQLIGKNPIAVDGDSNYFDSDFVKRVWKIDTTKREDAWLLVVEALAIGADIKCIHELALKWSLTEEDLKEFIVRYPEPNKEQISGMDIFIKEILKKDQDTVWDNLITKREIGDIK